MKGWRVVRFVAKERCGRRRSYDFYTGMGKLGIRSEIKVSLTSKIQAARYSETSTRNKHSETMLGEYYK